MLVTDDEYLYGSRVERKGVYAYVSRDGIIVSIAVHRLLFYQSYMCDSKSVLKYDKYSELYWPSNKSQ